MEENSRRSYGHLSGKALNCVFAALMMAMFVGSLDQTITSTAMSSIAGELNGVDRMVWVTTAYMLTSTIMMPIYGKLGDLFGRKHLFLFAMTVFTFGSTVTAAAPIIGLFVVAVVMAACFVVIERRVKEPLMPLHLFKNRNFILCTITGMMLMVAMMGVTSCMPACLQIVEGLSASVAGCLLIPMTLCLMVASGGLQSSSARPRNRRSFRFRPDSSRFRVQNLDTGQAGDRMGVSF